MIAVKKKGADRSGWRSVPGFTGQDLEPPAIKNLDSPFGGEIDGIYGFILGENRRSCTKLPLLEQGSKLDLDFGSQVAEWLKLDRILHRGSRSVHGRS